MTTHTNTLHVNLHNGGKSGMCNSIMSIQVGLIMRELGGFDHVKFYFQGNPYLFPENENVSGVLGNFGERVSFEYGPTPLAPYQLPSTHTTAYYAESAPPKEFMNGRLDSFNLTNLAVRYGDCVLNESLGYFSYVFSLSRSERRMVYDLIFSGRELSFSEDIFSMAMTISEEWGIPDSIAVHVRRGDYMMVESAKNASFDGQALLGSINRLMDSYIGLPKYNQIIVLTDEKDRSYFDPLVNAVESNQVRAIKRVLFLDDIVAARFPDVPSHIQSAVVLCAAVFAGDFMGTMYSTFSGIIQQMRHASTGVASYKYLFPQDNSIKLNMDGSIKRSSFGTYSWNRLENLSESMRSILFWAFEHPESSPSTITINHSISVYPEFLSAAECRMIIGKFTHESNHVRENRDRAILSISDPDLSDIVSRVAEQLGVDTNRFEPSIQFFKQYANGQTFLHCDSLHEDHKGRRIASVLFYLNTAFRGSKINFPYSGVTIEPSRGAMIVYPLIDEYGVQNKHFAHEATVITEGVKYMCYMSIKER